MAACVCQHSAPSAESSRFYRIFSSVHASVSGRIIGRNAQRLDATPTRISRAHVQSMRATDGASRSTTSKAVTSSVLDDQQVTMGDKLELKGMNIEELAGFCELLGERAPEKRAMQLWRWMYADVPTYGGKTYIHSLGETIGKQNGFSAAFCEAAGAHGKVGAGIEVNIMLWVVNRCIIAVIDKCICCPSDLDDTPRQIQTTSPP